MKHLILNLIIALALTAPNAWSAEEHNHTH